MLCKDCKYGFLYIDWPYPKSFQYKNGGVGVECDKYHLICDTSHPEARQCIEDDCDVIWRAAMQKGSRYDA